MEEPKGKKNGALTAIAVTTTIGTELAITTVLGFYGGRLLDDKLGTDPWFMIGGILAGVGLGIVGVIKTMQQFFSN